MTLLRQLLLLPLLAPLLAVLLVGAVNPKPQLRLRLLTWTSPALPLGVWLMLAGGGGAALSAAATSLALAQGMGAQAAPSAARRQVRRPAGPSWSPWREDDNASRTEATANGPSDPGDGWPGAGPSRSPGEPAPTVEARYRVLRRPARGSAGQASSGAAGAEPAPSTSAARASANGSTAATAAATISDDWGQALSGDW